MKMTLYDNIKHLRPYFYSLREFSSNVSLDLKIPLTWKYIESIQEGNVTIKTQDKNEKVNLISIMAPTTKEGYENIFIEAKKIIDKNLEDEEKSKLFNEKVFELKEMFMNTSLDKLKEISFLKEKKNEPQTRKVKKTSTRKEQPVGGERILENGDGEEKTD